VGLSVLFNEPKLLKSHYGYVYRFRNLAFSALQRAEIAEIGLLATSVYCRNVFQCSSTSRNC